VCWQAGRLVSVLDCTRPQALQGKLPAMNPGEAPQRRLLPLLTVTSGVEVADTVHLYEVTSTPDRSTSMDSVLGTAAAASCCGVPGPPGTTWACGGSPGGDVTGSGRWPVPCLLPRKQASLMHCRRTARRRLAACGRSCPLTLSVVGRSAVNPHAIRPTMTRVRDHTHLHSGQACRATAAPVFGPVDQHTAQLTCALLTHVLEAYTACLPDPKAQATAGTHPQPSTRSQRS
jgi:hypothetical protein